MKTPILLISGWAHTAETLQPLADRLAGHGPVRVLAIHELGEASGRSDESNRSDFSRYAAGLFRELCQQNGPCCVAGWSMGGMIALEAAARWPDRVAGLVMISSAPRLVGTRDFPEGVPLRNLKAMYARLRKAPESTLQGFFMDADFPLYPDERALTARISAALALGTERLAEQLYFLMQADLRPLIGRMTRPTLVVHGRLDRIMPPEAAAWLPAHRPGVQLRVWEDAGHGLPWQHPDRVASAINDFVRGVS